MNAPLTLTEVLPELFPFFLEVDDNMSIREFGASLSHVFPGMKAGDDVHEWLDLESPRTPFTARGLRSANRQLVVLRGTAKDVAMRGQILDRGEPEGLLFLCSPWLELPDDLAQLGLTATDFALHDPVMDLLHVVQAQRAGFDDLREIAWLLEEREHELRTAHRELEVQYRNLTELASARQRFLANMSHEMRTPLNGVIGSVDLLIPTVTGGEQAEGLQHIRSSALDLLSTVDALLEIAGNTGDTSAYENTRWEPRRLISAVAGEHRREAHERGVTFEIQIGDQVPAVMTGDPLRIGRIITNLVANAAEFSVPGVVIVKMGITAGKDEKVARLVVSSLGDAIAPATQERIFEPFFQVETGRNRRHSGSGLGLTIARKLAEELGGAVWYDRAIGRNEFIFDFPVIASKDVTPEAVNAPMISTDLAVTPFDCLNVLVVEDDEINQVVVSRMIDRLGHRCTIASSGWAALESTRDDEFDLVLMDLHMPGLDGIETAAAMHEHLDGRMPPVIAVTADVMPESIAACREAGFVDVLTKPLRLAVVEECLGRFAHVSH